MRKPTATISPTPVRKVLLAVHSDDLDRRLLEYTGNLCRRIGAGLDVLWLQAGNEIPPLLGAFFECLRQDRVAYRLLPRDGCLRSEVQRQVAQDRRITVVVVNSLQAPWHDADKANSGDWRERLPCPLVEVCSAEDPSS